MAVVFKAVFPYQVEISSKLGLVFVFPGFGIAQDGGEVHGPLDDCDQKRRPSAMSLEGPMDHDTHRHSNPVLPFWIRVFETVLTLAVESAERGK